MRGLGALRIKPHHLHHPDKARRTVRFRLPFAEGRRLVDALRGRLSGLCRPIYVVDIPGGQVPVAEERASPCAGSWRLTDFRGKRHRHDGLRSRSAGRTPRVAVPLLPRGTGFMRKACRFLGPKSAARSRHVVTDDGSVRGTDRQELCPGGPCAAGFRPRRLPVPGQAPTARLLRRRRLWGSGRRLRERGTLCPASRRRAPRGNPCRRKVRGRA